MQLASRHSNITLRNTAQGKLESQIVKKNVFSYYYQYYWYFIINITIIIVNIIIINVTTIMFHVSSFLM